MREDNPDLYSYRCIIHRSLMCATLSEEHTEVMNTLMKLNFLRVSSLHTHHLCREFLTGVDASSYDPLLHCSFR